MFLFLSVAVYKPCAALTNHLPTNSTPTQTLRLRFSPNLFLPFSSHLKGSWQCSLQHLQFVKVEGVKFESSFMSERASLFLSSIGLLGEYCPTSRKKNRSSSHIVDCMHFEAHNVHSSGCQLMRPHLVARISSGKGGFLSTVGNTSAALCLF